MIADKPRRQCVKCPWKVGVDPYEIPDGYDLEKHQELSRTIAVPGSLQEAFGPLRIMACHETGGSVAHLPCVGWLWHQLREGNNISIRLAARRGQIDANVEVVGPQHACFEDTLPEDARYSL